MSTKSVASANAIDVAICNFFQPPSIGCHAGSGMHVAIPIDWQARVLAGQDVPGCTYAKLEVDGSLYVTGVVQASLAIPAQVSLLTLAQQTEAASLSIALLTAPVISASAQIQAQQSLQ